MGARINGDDVLKDRQSADTRRYENVRIRPLDRKGTSVIVHLLDTQNVLQQSAAVQT
jgi:hypothetical protein